MPYIYGLDWTYVVYVIPPLILALWAQFNVKSTFAKYSRVPSERGMTGYAAARLILDSNGLQHVKIEKVMGNLTDHYDPTANVIRLSDSVHGECTVAAVGVAAHEAGHAVQFACGYKPIKIRSAIIPLTRIGSTFAFPLVLLGIFFSSPVLANLGVLLFGAAVLFQLVTLPVEFNASRRAIAALEESGMTDEAVKSAGKVLRAAALTYVAALATAIGNFLRLLTLANRSKRN